MANTDPFGREQGEDPLAAMGWARPADTQTTAAAADVAAPEQPDEAVRQHARREQIVPGIPGQQRRRGGLGCAVAVIAVLFIGSIAAVVIPVVVTTVDEVRDAIPQVPTVPAVPKPGGTGPAPSGEAPRGLERRSLLRRENLAPALRRLRRLTDGAPIRLVRLDAETLLVQTVRDGRARFGQASWRGDADVYASGGGGEGVATFGWSRLDPAAPARIVRAATRGKRAASFDYLVLMRLSDVSWSGFLRRGGGTFNASADGRRVDRVG
jgi:hypothetical protein